MLVGRFIARPQRFLVSINLENGKTTLAYCANPGSFQGCLEAGSQVLLWDSERTERKRRHTWRAIRLATGWIGTDTHLANELVHKALVTCALPCFTGFRLAAREPRNAKGGRLDFLLENDGQRCFVEVKSATVVTASAARFPDSVSPRATTHLKELIKHAKAGQRAVLLFLIQRGDVDRLEINLSRDPAFARIVKLAAKTGVEFIAIKHSVTAKGFGWPVEVPVVLGLR